MTVEKHAAFPTRDQLDEMKALVNSQVDTVWLLVVALRVLSMQAGLLMLEAGVVRTKNTRLTMVKNIIEQRPELLKEVFTR